MTFLTGLISTIIRPILQEELGKLMKKMEELYKENNKFKAIDREVELYLPKLAEASTAEERWALLDELDEKRNHINNSLND